MEVLSWGEMTLEVDASRIYTFNNFDWSMGYTSKTKDLKKKKPKTTAKAPNLEQISFSVLVCRDLGVDVMDEVNDWRALCNDGEANELYIGGERIGDEGSTWRIKSLKCSEVVFDASVSAYSAELSISMDEVANGVKKATTAKKKKKKKKATKKVATQKNPSGSSSITLDEYRARRGF